MAQLTLEDRGRLDAFKAVTVKHAHLTRVDDQLSLWVEEHTDATHVLLCGPGGVGKSKVLSVVAERFKDEEQDRFVVPILLLEPIPPDLGPYLRLIITGKSSMRSKSICWSKNWWGTWLTSWPRRKPLAQNLVPSIGSRCGL
jgi:hypothetical protein